MSAALNFNRVGLCLMYCVALAATQASAAIITRTMISPDQHIQSNTQTTALQFLPYANPHAPKGGRLVLAADGSFDNLNSMNGQGNAVLGINYVFDSLLSKSLDQAGVFYPLLAEKVSFDPLKTGFVIFHINPRARFSDGRELDATDVKYSFDLYKKQSNYGLQMYLSDLKDVQVLSKYQVKMRFHSAHHPEMITVLAQMPIYAAKEWQKRDFKAISLTPILGSGPYTIAQIDPGRSIQYRRNPHYWARDLWVNRGRYNVNLIQYRYYRSPDAKFEAFKSGLVSFYEETQVNKWVSDYQFPAAQQGLVQRYRFRHHNPVLTQSVVFNARRAPFSDIRFRQALSYAYDFEWLNKAMFAGQYQRLNSFFSNSELASPAQPSAEERAILQPYLKQLHPIQRHMVQHAWQYPVSDANGFNRTNLLQARQLLLQAGYRYRAGQLLDLQGKVLKFEFLLYQSEQQRLILPYLRHLKRLGIDVRIRMVDALQYDERRRQYNFDMLLDSMPQSLTPGQEQKQFWGSQAAKEVGNYNYAGIQNPVIDQIIERLLHSKTRQQRILYTRVLDRLLRAGYYHIPTYGVGEYWYAYWNIYQRPANTAKLNVALDYWWVDTGKQQRVAGYLRSRAMPNS